MQNIHIYAYKYYLLRKKIYICDINKEKNIYEG